MKLCSNSEQGVHMQFVNCVSVSNVEEPLCKPPQSYDDHIALPEVISIPTLLLQ